MIRKEIWQEGSLKEIASVFLEPLLRRKPKRMQAKVWLERLWDVDRRHIQSFTVISPFSMPGRLRKSQTEVVQGQGQRRIKPGWVLWVRLDDRNFGRVDVEVTRRGRDASQVFLLDQIEWIRIKGHLEPNKV